MLPSKTLGALESTRRSPDTISGAELDWNSLRHLSIRIRNESAGGILAVCRNKKIQGSP